MTDYYAKCARDAADKVAAALTLPLPDDEYDIGVQGKFDPWEIFPCFYGSYSQDFDIMAIDVLESFLTKEYRQYDLAENMFKEYLCRFDLCDYGTSPRVCFPTEEFRALLPELIRKWRLFSLVQWGEDATSTR